MIHEHAVDEEQPQPTQPCPYCGAPALDLAALDILAARVMPLDCPNCGGITRKDLMDLQRGRSPRR